MAAKRATATEGMQSAEEQNEDVPVGDAATGEDVDANAERELSSSASVPVHIGPDSEEEAIDQIDRTIEEHQWKLNQEINLARDAEAAKQLLQAVVPLTASSVVLP